MPTAAQVKALIRSHAEGDEQRFYSVVLQVAAQAARQGHGKFAQELRDVIDRARAVAPQNGIVQWVRPVPMVQPRGELAGLFTAAYPKTRLSEMALEETRSIVVEHATELEARGKRIDAAEKLAETERRRADEQKNRADEQEKMMALLLAKLRAAGIDPTS